MINVDTCIHARWIIPVVPRGQLLENHTVVVQAGKIVALLPQQEAKTVYQAANSVELNQHVLIPGLVNTHTHTAMNLFRGMADDLPLMTWLNEHIWPAENKWVSEEFVHAGASLAIAEMIKSGTTTFNDMYFYPDVVADLAISHGVRAHVGAVVFDFPSAWGSGPEEYFAKAETLIADYKDNDFVTINIGPHAPYTVSDAHLMQCAEYAKKYACKINIHLHETEQEVTDSLKDYGKRPIQRLADLGFLDKNVIAVHMTALTEEDIALAAQQQISIVTCPESNLKLASGFCPLKQLQSAGINLAIGTDSAASNNDLDMLSEMRTTALLAKTVSSDPTACSASEVLEMATLGGAKAVGAADKIGSLEAEKEADLVAIDMSDIESQPMYNPISQVIYSSSRNQVSDVWVKGQRLLDTGQLTRVDVEQLLRSTALWQQRLKNK